MIQLAVERWHSSENAHEVHFFVKNDASKYVMGFDPEVWDEKDILEILKAKGYVYEV